MENNERKAKNSEARIRANNKYKKANYQRISVDIRPEQAEAIRETAKQFDISIAQLIINSVNEYKTKHGADTAQPEQDPTKSPIESGETAGAQPEEETEEETEETTEEEEEEENQTTGAETTEEEEPQEDEDIPEELKAVRAAWARMGAFNEKITTERKRREAEERERRREGAEEDIYLMR